MPVPGVQAAGEYDRVEECEPQRSRDRADSVLVVDAIEDGVEAEQLTWRVQVDELIDERMRRPWRGEAISDGLPDLALRQDRLGQVQITERGVGLAQLRAADLRVASRTAVFARRGPERLVGVVRVGRQRRRAGR